MEKDEDDITIRLFVYGSLRVGRRFHFLLSGSSQVEDYVSTKYPHYIMGAYQPENRNPNIFEPMISVAECFSVEAGAGYIAGEIYELKLPRILTLDQIYYQDKFLKRETIEMEGTEPASIYLIDKGIKCEVENPPILTSERKDMPAYLCYSRNDFR